MAFENRFDAQPSALLGETAPVSETWHHKSVQEVVRALATRLEHGLTPEEAARRLEEFGANELREHPRPPFWRMVLDQFKSFVVLILIAASLISAGLGEYVEAAAIIAIVLLNAVIGVIQESRAEEALAALKKLAAPDGHVIRGGSRQTVPSRELVPGDIVLVEAGNFVPADIRLIESVNLRVEEAALTGESVPVEKSAHAILEPDIPLGDRTNTAFMGTLVAYGRGKGVVTGTGRHSQIGMIAELLQTLEEEPTPLQVKLDQLGKSLGVAALIICGLVFAIAVVRETDLSAISAPGVGLAGYLAQSQAVLVEVFTLAVSLAIAAVPEGLPAVVTITLALGMREMIKRHALIRRLASVETLGSATVICSDKTGTLTQNQMTAVRLWVDGHMFQITGDGYNPRGEFRLDGQAVDLRRYPAALTTLWAAVLDNDALLESPDSNANARAFRMVGDPTEGALIAAAAKAGAWKNELERAFPRVDEVPFDSERKRMSTIHEVRAPRAEDASPYTDGAGRPRFAVATKGAPDVVLGLCTRYQRMDDTPAPLDDEMRRQILEANAAMARDALRVLAVAYRELPERPGQASPENVERDLTFVGLLGIIDPPRPEVKPAIAKARRAGIRTVMITGDYPDTAHAIAGSIDLLRPGRQVMSGGELNETEDEGLVRAARTTDVFARVSPQHKVRIVDALKRLDEVVAMTGDGVNDAPALKRADIGVAMGITGTDVAKETADMVLTDDNYASIVSAVEQGRIIYANIRKFVFFLLSSNVAEVMIIFLATLAGLPHPLTAIQLLWLNLITDGAPALALAMEKGDPDVMDRPPRPKTEPIIHGPMRLGVAVQTVAQTGATLGAFALGLIWHLRRTVPDGYNPILHLLQYDWTGVDVLTAETMAFATLSACELFRAFTVRSERFSIFRIGPFSNRHLLAAVALSIALLMAVINVPFLQPIFNTAFLTAREWAVVVGFALVPAIAEEITKFYLRRKG